MDENFGITEKGFLRPLFDEILESKIRKARQVLGVDIDVSETSFLGQLLRLEAWDEAEIWEQIEKVYFSAFVNSSEGTGLDNVGMYLTITRRPATKSLGMITIYGDNDTVIPAGFRVATMHGEVFETVEEATIVNGRADVKVSSLASGKDTNVPSKSIVKIVNPMPGVKGVINAEETLGGLDIETDDEFRERYKKSYSKAGGSTVPALTSALLDIDGVVDAEVVENVTMETVDGIPPKAFECFVYGGTEDEIIDAIYRNKSAGIQAFGEIFKTVTDTKGRTHKIGYTKAKVKDIWVKIRVKRDSDYKGDEALKRFVINYIGGFDDNNMQYPGLKLGKSVIFTKIQSLGMCLGGIIDLEAFVSTDGKDWKKTNIDVARDSIARTSMDKVIIEHV